MNTEFRTFTELFYKKLLLKNSQYSQDWNLLFNKVEGLHLISNNGTSRSKLM